MFFILKLLVQNTETALTHFRSTVTYLVVHSPKNSHYITFNCYVKRWIFKLYKLLYILRLPFWKLLNVDEFNLFITVWRGTVAATIINCNFRRWFCRSVIRSFKLKQTQNWWRKLNNFLIQIFLILNMSPTMYTLKPKVWQIPRNTACMYCWGFQRFATNFSSNYNYSIQFFKISFKEVLNYTLSYIKAVDFAFHMSHSVFCIFVTIQSLNELD